MKGIQFMKVKITQVIQMPPEYIGAEPTYRYYYNLYDELDRIKESGFFYIGALTYGRYSEDLGKKFSKIKELNDRDIDNYIIRKAFSKKYDTLSIEWEETLC